jgi:peptide/nickel transport system substrate-binding protein
MRKTLIMLLVLVLALVPMFSACSSQQADNTSKDASKASPNENSKQEEKVVVVAQTRDVTALDYALVAQTETQNISNNIFDTLVRLNDNYEYEPWLAKSWENPDPKTWIFHLRSGVKFTNGESVNAEAVKYSLERIMNPEVKSPQAWRLSLVDEVQTPDENTVVIKTKEPYAALINIMTLMFIVPPKAVEEMGNQEFGQHPIGSGPFIVDEYVPGEKVVLKANKDYWKGAPKIDEVIFRPISEASTRVASLETGEADIITAVPPNRLKELKDNKDINVDAKTGVMLYMGLDTFHSPLDNVKVRQAINYAIDVDTIVDSILLGTAKPMAGPVFRVTKGFDSSIKPYPYDPKKAKELLKEAGYENGFDLVLSTPPQGVEGTTNTLEVAQAIAAQLKDVGIQVKLDITDPATQFQRYKNKEFQAYLFTWDTQIEPDRYLYSLFDSDARGYYYKNEEVDKLLVEGKTTMDQKTRVNIYEKLHRLLYDDAPWGFLYNQEAYYGYRANVKFQAPVDGMMFMYNVEKN